ncbi:MAG: hypothetical protein K2R93_08635 [Gemmatimonadaceae bacterium]|nr:hypothetical protein [Gemmatimonadaceae bacterium]
MIRFAHRSRASRTRRSRAGFTLFAMVVAIVLLAAGLSSLATANANTVKLQTLAQNRTNAIAIARAYIEQVRTRDPWLLQSESPVRLNADGTASASGAYTRSLTVTTTRQNLVRVEVRVDYPRATTPLLLTTSVFRGNGLNGAS